MSLFLPIFRALNDVHARYVTVGGLAVVLHGHARLTADIDLIVDLEPEEALKVIRALSDRGFLPRAPVRAENFADAESRRSWASTDREAVTSGQNLTLWRRLHRSVGRFIVRGRHRRRRESVPAASGRDVRLCPTGAIGRE